MPSETQTNLDSHPKAQNKDIERDFFNNFHHENPYDVFTPKGNTRLLDEIFSHLGNVSDLKGLDMGCGTGTFTDKYRKRGLSMTGMDISDKSIEAAKSFFPECSFVTGDVEKTDFSDNTFDVVFLSGVLHHFPEPHLMLKEAHRVLKPEGYLLSFDPHYYNPFMLLYRVKASPFYSPKGVTENEQPIKIKETREQFNRVNYKELKVYAISGISFQYVESRLANSFLFAYNFADKILDFFLFRPLLGSFVISIARK